MTEEVSIKLPAHCGHSIGFGGDVIARIEDTGQCQGISQSASRLVFATLAQGSAQIIITKIDDSVLTVNIEVA